MINRRIRQAKRNARDKVLDELRRLLDGGCEIGLIGCSDVIARRAIGELAKGESSFVFSLWPDESFHFGCRVRIQSNDLIECLGEIVAPEPLDAEKRQALHDQVKELLMPGRYYEHPLVCSPQPSKLNARPDLGPFPGAHCLSPRPGRGAAGLEPNSTLE